MNRRWLAVCFMAALGCNDTATNPEGPLPDLPADTAGGGGGEVGAELPKPPTDVSTDAGDEPKPWFGTTCAESADCPSGWCVESQCTDTCISECPDGWSCKNVANAGPDVTFLCMPDKKVLCAVCAIDADCGAGGARCIEVGAEGTYCLLPCGDAASACPLGFACETVQGGTTQCVPTSSSCACTEATKGQVRGCSVGQCAGKETCNGKEGWSGCTANEPAPETCNGKDDDCDGVVDPAGTTGCTEVFTDVDGDGFGKDGSKVCVCQPGAGTATSSGDCDDLDDAVHPGATEVCNGQDDDCNGAPDPEGSKGCVAYAVDADGDGFGGVGDVHCLCAPTAPWTTLVLGDCDDSNKAIHPSAAEACDGVDEDCDGDIDDGVGGKPCQVTDGTGDAKCPGVTVCEGGTMTCAGKLPSAEVCNGSDDDCDGVVDEGTAGGECLNQNAYGSCEGTLACTGDAGLVCSAKTPAPESCNGSDDDCDGIVDPAGAFGCASYAKDADGDGWGVEADMKCLCTPSAPWTALISGDCDDAAKGVHPGAVEKCNGVDEDCDGSLDDGVAGTACTVANGDGACPGITTCVDAAIVCSAKAPMAEACNGSDDDCDGLVDEGVDAFGCLDYHTDADKDGFGAEDVFACLCKATSPYTTLVGGDCDDASKQSYPGAAEVCNGKDDNCNDAIDDPGAQGCSVYLKDGDGDGYGVGVAGKCLCAPDETWKAELSGDCDDGNADRHPGATEICNGKDENCNLFSDETCDADGDGWCAVGSVIVGSPAACKNGTNDCDDTAFLVHPSGAEVCNGADDDCDTEIDEGVQSPCGGCTPVCDLTAGPGGGDPFATDPDFFNGTGTTPEGYIQLDAQTTQLRTLWVANSGQGSVSKIDTGTGKEVARYTACGDPSRTSVASDGSVWVGCRGDGQVAHIALDQETCVDKNGNGKIETSKDTNGNGSIDGAEMLAAGTDECVLLVTQPDGATVARGLAIDKDDYPWVGFWNTQHVRKLDPKTGKSLVMVDFGGAAGRPYGLALDQKGRIWVALRDAGTLGFFDPNQDPIPKKTWAMPNSFNMYGIAVDQQGEVWMGTGENGQIVNFDPVTEQFTVVSPGGWYGNTRGIAASLDGYIFAAHHTWTCTGAADARTITKIDAKTKAVVAHFDLGGMRGPVGVAIDFDGALWAVNQCTSTATKLDADTGQVLGEYPTGPSPYTYSDMTGFALKTVVSPVGTYTQVFQGWASGTTKWQTIDLDVNLPDKTSAEVRYRTADTVAGLATAVWGQWFGPFPPEALPLQIPSWAPAVGRYLAVEVRLKSTEKKVSPVLKLIKVTASGG